MPTRYDGPHHITYTVSGSLEEVADIIAARPEAGQTVWEPNLSWKSDGNGVITAADVTCVITIELPVWDGHADASPADRASWDAFHAALTHHEDGHVQIVHEWFDNSDGWLLGKTELDVDAALEALDAQTQFHSDEFDALTNHGIDRGCVIVVNAAAGSEEVVEEQ